MPELKKTQDEQQLTAALWSDLHPASGRIKPAISAGFLLRGAVHNLTVRLKFAKRELRDDVGDGGHALHAITARWRSPMAYRRTTRHWPNAATDA